MAQGDGPSYSQIAVDCIEDNNNHDDDSDNGDSDNSDAESVCSVSSSTAGEMADTLYIGSFPPYVKEQQIRSHFSDFATFIKNVSVKSKKNTAHAFITFSSGEVADDARQILHGSKLMGKYQIKVTPAQPKASTNPKKKTSACREGTKVFLGNLPPQTKDVDVSNHFAKYRQHLVGNPVIKKISKEGESPYCIAFLSFRSRKVAVTAIEEMNKTKLLQRSIRVQFHKGNETQQRAEPSVAAVSKEPSRMPENISQYPSSVPQTSIQLTGIPPNLDREDLVDLLPNPSCLLSCDFLPGKEKERVAVMNFTSADSASEAVGMFDGKTFFGQTLQASIHNPSHSRIPGQSSGGAGFTTVHVFNLPDNSTGSAVFHLFKPFGRIASKVEVIGNRALVPFSTMEGAKNAVAQCHSTIFNGNVIKVTMEATQASAYCNCSRVEVSNFPTKWNGGNVFHHFKQFGRIDGKVEVTQGKDETAPNSAVIKFVHHEHACQALSLDGSLVEGVKLRVVMMEAGDPQLVSTNVASSTSPPPPPPLLHSQSIPSHPPSSLPLAQMFASNCVPAKGPGFRPVQSGNTPGSHLQEGRGVPACTPPTLLHSQSTTYPLPSAAHTATPLSHPPMAIGVPFHTQDSGPPLMHCDSAGRPLSMNNRTAVSGSTPPSSFQLQSSSSFSPPSCLPSDSSPGSEISPLFPPHPTSSTSPAFIKRAMSPQLFRFIEQHQAGQEIAVFKSRGGSFCYNGSLATVQTTNGQELAYFVQHTLDRYKEHSLPCSPDQWNRLMLVSAQGTKMMDELREPFKSHPNVEIHEMSTPGQLQLLFVGTCDAVDSAFSHFFAALNNEVQVKSLVMQTLTQLKPGLADDISKRCGVYLEGYSQHSTCVSFRGSPENVRQAREEFERQVSSVSPPHKVRKEIPLGLLNSAMKVLQNDGLHVAILEDDSGTHIGSFSDADIEKLEGVLQQKPYQNSVPILGEVSSLSLDELEERCRSDCVRVRKEEEKILIEGFVKEDVQQARVLLQESIKVMRSSHSLVCTPEQEAYLLHVLTSKECSDRAQQLKTSLPASLSLSKEKRKIFLKGTQDERDVSTKVLHESVPLHYKSCPFTCRPAFYSQIEQQVLKQHITVESIKVEEAQEEKKEGKKAAHKFCIILFANNAADLDPAVQDLKGVEPGSLTISIRPKARQLVYNYKGHIEKQHNCRLEFRDKPSSKVVVHALSEEARGTARAAIESHVNENFVVTKEIPDVPLSALHMKYLLVKHKPKLSELEASLEEWKIPFRLQTSKALLLKDKTSENRVKVRGKLKQVEEAAESMNQLAATFLVEDFVVCCPSRILPTWCKRWNQLKQEQEESRELMVEYNAPPKSTTTSDESSMVNILFIVYGSDADAVKELKCSIQEEMQQELESIKLTLSQDRVRAVLTGLKNRQLNVGRWLVDIKPDGPNILLSAPKVAMDDLSVVKNEIENFLDNKTTSSTEFIGESAAVNLLLTCKKEYGYFSLASKVCQEAAVSVQPVYKGNDAFLSLRGRKVDLEAVRQRLQETERQVKHSLIKKQVEVEALLAPALVPAFRQQVQAKLRGDYCVVATFPDQQIPVTVLKEVYLQPSSSAIRVKIELHKGSLLCEKVDVIVNSANENLNHCGGLAKIVADAGGPQIQSESSRYVQEKGKLKAGKTVCLGPGALPYKKVIHAVSPRWTEGSSLAESALYSAVFDSLREASSHGFESIALPAIGTGVFGVPEDVCARTSLKAVRDFCQSSLSSSIHTVIFSLFTSETQKEFKAALPFLPPPECTEEIRHTKSPKENGKQQLHWEWMNDQRLFSPYSPDTCQVLTSEYKKNPQGCATITVSGTAYEIDFANMIQSNIVTGAQTSVRKMVAFKSSNWSFLGDDKQRYIPYSYQQACAIEAMYQAGQPSTLEIRGKTYTFDFQQMVQINVLPGKYRRPIQRTGDLPTPKAANLVSPGEQPERKGIFITLEGPSMFIGQAEEEVKKRLQQCVQVETIPLIQTPDKSFEQNLKRIAHKHQVEVNIVSSPPGQAAPKATVELKGVRARVERATREIQQLIIEQQSSTESAEFPPEWQSQTQTTELLSVPLGSPEWMKVEQKFKATMPSSNIVEIIRVQNTWLWEKYVQHKKMMQKKSGTAGVNELELFHGTRGNNPRNIYEGEEGFDMRFSSQGMWGYANYFAVNASYSNGYAYTNANGQKEMFLVKVLTGDSYQCASNPSLRMPPEKGSVGQVKFSANRYDTVSGFTGGSQVYMTYSNEKSYPAYLIRYN